MKSMKKVDTNYLKEYDARIDSERDKAKAALKSYLILKILNKLQKLRIS